MNLNYRRYEMISISKIKIYLYLENQIDIVFYVMIRIDEKQYDIHLVKFKKMNVKFYA